MKRNEEMNRKKLRKMNIWKKRFIIRTSKLFEQTKYGFCKKTNQKAMFLRKLSNLIVKQNLGISSVFGILACDYRLLSERLRFLQKRILTLQLQHTSLYVHVVESTNQ